MRKFREQAKRAIGRTCRHAVSNPRAAICSSIANVVRYPVERQIGIAGSAADQRDLDLGQLVAVYFHTDADLPYDGACPSHGRLLFISFLKYSAPNPHLTLSQVLYELPQLATKGIKDPIL
jgi:hypothetical protein